MQPAIASALPPDSEIAKERASALAILGQILAMAVPLALGAMVTSGLNLGKIAILARSAHPEALELLSLLQPVFLLVLAMMECFAITNQVFSARSKRNWPRRGILKSSRYLSGLAVLCILVLAAIAYAVSRLVHFDNRMIEQTLSHAPVFLLSLSGFVVFDIYYGALRGQGRLLRSLLPFLGLALIDLAVTYGLISQFGWGFEAILAGNLAGPLVMLPIVILLVRIEAGSGPEVATQQISARLRPLLIVVGLPIAASILIGSISAAVIFPVLAQFGADYASAFLVVLRFRIAFMIPAIAVGSVIAILVNQAAEDGDASMRLRYLVIGIPVVLLIYAAATALLPYWCGSVLDALVSQKANALALHQATDFVMAQLQITFFLIAAATMLQVMLEQLGRATHVLVITIAAEIITSGGVMYAAQAGYDLTMILRLLCVVAAVTFGLLLVQLVLLIRQVRRGYVV